MKGVKFKTPPEESEELDRFYNIVFDDDSFCASWAGRVGHYPYGNSTALAPNNDGYIYLWPEIRGSHRDAWWKMSADSSIAKSMCKEFIEIRV
ncbi:hypothetical protein I5398_11850 [Citrobacter freundii]|uniref:hypothetical protein n=1 Tax=Citrobacter TaxID=544 RepID=UPI001D615849|nr:hypothetical protein [Citrobacter sp. Cpo035]MBJ8796723.1 hypothetical protein [Citrobacter freundii]MDM2915085.1 hypothetical protein [Citrobacter sp. Cpo035]